jgi:hypothetical protein
MLKPFVQTGIVKGHSGNEAINFRILAIIEVQLISENT